jgi:hypothetical protein
MHAYIRNQQGAVLVTALMLMSVIAMVSTGVYLTTKGDVKQSAVYRDAKGALYAAEAGIHEARARLRGSASASTYVGDPAASFDSLWSAYILTSSSWQTSDDPDYNGSYRNYIPTTASKTNTTASVNSLQSTMDYFVKIRHKREYDAEEAGHTTANTHYYDGDGTTAPNTAASPGNIVYFGYSDDPANPTTACQFTTSGSTAYRPVEIITAYGQRRNSRKIVEVEVVRYPGPPVTATLYGKGNITINGSSGYISGSDNCGNATSVDPVYVMSPATVTENPAPTYDPPGSGAVTGTKDIDIDSLVDQFKSSATQTITSDQNGTNYGTATNFITAYSDTSDPHNVQGLKMQNTTGYGILLVEGDMTMAGGFSWNGLVLVTGTLTFNGGGAAVNIRGAVLANQTVDINGGLDIRYDSCMIDSSLNNQAFRTISWFLH